jgi:hypothetical protein
MSSQTHTQTQTHINTSFPPKFDNGAWNLTLVSYLFDYTPDTPFQFDKNKIYYLAFVTKAYDAMFILKIYMDTQQFTIHRARENAIPLLECDYQTINNEGMDYSIDEIFECFHFPDTRSKVYGMDYLSGVLDAFGLPDLKNNYMRFENSSCWYVEDNDHVDYDEDGHKEVIYSEAFNTFKNTFILHL